MNGGCAPMPKRPELSGDVTKLQGQLPDAEWKGKRDARSIISIGERALASLLLSWGAPGSNPNKATRNSIEKRAVLFS
ncbi:hypothetical protein CEXT_674131 [Caerostris extrusa]|uniref:Uncharacterized protein n=1 Tax=Caerostris extrusa TaxID=172846 RepID=A0AAV4UV31_CAEEX|nr:hypothetical protein CEXT_674131 [Caerostris extrusa]